MVQCYPTPQSSGPEKSSENMAGSSAIRKSSNTPKSLQVETTVSKQTPDYMFVPLTLHHLHPLHEEREWGVVETLVVEQQHHQEEEEEEEEECPWCSNPLLLLMMRLHRIKIMYVTLVSSNTAMLRLSVAREKRVLN